MSQPPFISQVRTYWWKDGDATLYGVAIMAGARVLAFLTADEAVKIADRLVDVSEQLLQTQENNA